MKTGWYRGPEFAQHVHVWTVVEIDNTPVGVACSVCEQTMPIAEPTDHEPPVFDLKYGSAFRLRDPMLGTYSIYEIESVSTQSAFRERTRISIDLIEKPPF